MLGTNDAIFLQDGKEVHIEGKDLYSHARPAPLPFPGNPSFALEYIPNRNSLPYKEMYGLQGRSADTRLVLIVLSPIFVLVVPFELPLIVDGIGRTSDSDCFVSDLFWIVLCVLPLIVDGIGSALSCFV